MHMYVRMLERIASRSGPSKLLSFNAAHVLRGLQLMWNEGYVSRARLATELGVGSGAARTLIRHLTASGMVATARAGCYLTAKGKKLTAGLMAAIPAGVGVPVNSITVGNYNYAVLLRGYAPAIGTGIEQRDAVVRLGGHGATTLLFKDNMFVMPRTDYDCLAKEPEMRELLASKLKPKDGDVIIIGSASDRITAELGANSAALSTIAGHEKHDY